MRITFGESAVGGVHPDGWPWVLAAGATGLATASLAAGLGWDRDRFVALHAPAVLLLAVCYGRRSGTSLRGQVRRRWKSGLAVGLVIGALLARHVLALPGPRPPRDSALAAHLAWLGLVYGVVDAVLLTVLPVLAVYGAHPSEAMRRAGYRLRVGTRALLASLLVTALYHLGFPEFRGRALVQPLIGNGAMSAAYLLTGSPLTPAVAHVLLHGAAVVRGPGMTAQLPPHAKEKP